VPVGVPEPSSGTAGVVEMEVNPMAHLTDGRDKTAMGGPATRQHRFVAGLLCSEVRSQGSAPREVPFMPYALYAPRAACWILDWANAPRRWGVG
jgi:hypothetical protein